MKVTMRIVNLCGPYQGTYAWALEFEVPVSIKSLMALVRRFDLIGWGS
jgi:hypothetical protein